MFIIKREDDSINSIPVSEVKLDQLKPVSSKLAKDILKTISEKQSYPLEIANKLKQNEQKIYYHIRKLEKAGLIKVVRKEDMHGATANYYDLTDSAFFIRFKDFRPTHKISYLTKEEEEFLDPFVKDGKLDALIVVGSPDPHGPDMARSRDGYYGIDLALFLGTFLYYVPSFNVKLDTELTEKDLKQNLILIGGPVVNRITEKVNKKLPVRFDRDNRNIYSTVSGKAYPSDESGMIVKEKSPFNKDKKILVVAGKRFSGTKAAIIGFLQGFKQIIKGNRHNKKIIAKVVEGFDLDSDGAIDSVEFKE